MKVLLKEVETLVFNKLSIVGSLTFTNHQGLATTGLIGTCSRSRPAKPVVDQQQTSFDTLVPFSKPSLISSCFLRLMKRFN
jgi:hypothetical protein